MKRKTKVIIALLVGGLTSAIVGFIYGIVAFQCDLFLVFPFLVVGTITRAEQAVVEWLNIHMGPILLMAGLVFGFTAYAAHLYGGYSMLEDEIRTEIRRDWRFMSLSEEEQAIILKESTDYFLQREVGQTGLLGQFLFNTRAGISHIRVGESVFGENSIIGWIIELFKFAVIVLGTGLLFLGIEPRSPEVMADRAE